jgi:hypothetical protein
MRRGAAMALACAGIALLASGTAPGAPFKPLLGKYRASAPGAGPTNLMTLEVQRLGRRALKTRILALRDDCAAGLAPTPIALGRLLAKDFKYQASGTTTSTAYRVDIDGLFVNATTATARVKSSLGNLFPPPGVPPGTADICQDDTTFRLKYLKPRK